MLLSSLPGRPLDEARRRGWSELEVEPLEPDERSRLVAEYLASFAKALPSHLAKKVAQAPQASNPLFVRALLDELRVAASYERLEATLERYLAVTEVDDLYELMLERYERDYERERPGLMRGTFTALWAARRGLSEPELLALLGTNGSPIPRAVFSPLFLAARPSLVSNAGLLGFAHDFLKKVVEDRYLPRGEDKRAVHRKLADYFGTRVTTSAKVSDVLGLLSARWRTPGDTRALAELAWHLARAALWPDLRVLLQAPGTLMTLWALDEWEVLRLWDQLDRASHDDVRFFYRPTHLFQPSAYRVPVIVHRASRGNADLLRETWGALLPIAQLQTQSAPIHWLVSVISALPGCRGLLDTNRFMVAVDRARSLERKLDFARSEEEWRTAPDAARRMEPSTQTELDAACPVWYVASHLAESLERQDRPEDALQLIRILPAASPTIARGLDLYRLGGLVTLGRLDEAEVIWVGLRTDTRLPASRRPGTSSHAASSVARGARRVRRRPCGQPARGRHPGRKRTQYRPVGLCDSALFPALWW